MDWQFLQHLEGNESNYLTEQEINDCNPFRENAVCRSKASARARGLISGVGDGGHRPNRWWSLQTSTVTKRTTR